MRIMGGKVDCSLLDGRMDGWMGGRIHYSEGKAIVPLPWLTMIVGRCVALCRVGLMSFKKKFFMRM